MALNNLQILKYVLLLFSGWFLCLLTITYLGLSVLPNQDFYKKKLYYPGDNLEYFQRWSNWDGGGYRYISEQGYTPHLTVFFPAYPMLIKAITMLGFDTFRAAFLVSSVSTIVALFFFFKLVLLDFKKEVAKKALFALLIFPTSFYFLAVYNESLTLALAVSSFYFSRKQKWLLAYSLAGFAAATRLTGIAVLLGIVYEYFYQNRRVIDINLLWQAKVGKLFSYSLISIISLNILSFFPGQNLMLKGVTASVLEILNIPFFVITGITLIFFIFLLISKLEYNKIYSKNSLYLPLSFLPLIFYFLYQHVNFGSAFTFLKSELSWGKILSVPWQGPLFNLKFILLNPLKIGEFSAHMHVQLLSFILALICLIISYRKLRMSYTVFFFLVFLIPLFSGMLADITRYILIGFPMFLIFAQIKNDMIQKIGVLLSILLLSLLSILFFNSYFFI